MHKNKASFPFFHQQAELAKILLKDNRAGRASFNLNFDIDRLKDRILKEVASTQPPVVSQQRNPANKPSKYVFEPPKMHQNRASKEPIPIQSRKSDPTSNCSPFKKSSDSTGVEKPSKFTFTSSSSAGSLANNSVVELSQPSQPSSKAAAVAKDFVKASAVFGGGTSSTNAGKKVTDFFRPSQHIDNSVSPANAKPVPLPQRKVSLYCNVQ